MAIFVPLPGELLSSQGRGLSWAGAGEGGPSSEGGCQLLGPPYALFQKRGAQLSQLLQAVLGPQALPGALLKDGQTQHGVGHHVGVQGPELPQTHRPAVEVPEEPGY